MKVEESIHPSRIYAPIKKVHSDFPQCGKAKETHSICRKRVNHYGP